MIKSYEITRDGSCWIVRFCEIDDEPYESFAAFKTEEEALAAALHFMSDYQDVLPFDIEEDVCETA